MKKTLVYSQEKRPVSRPVDRSADRFSRNVTERVQDHYKKDTYKLRDYVQRKDREPLIGLEFVLEYKVKAKPDKNNTHYYCEICQLTVPLIPMIEHLLGVKHRTCYLEKVFPYVLKALPAIRDDVILFLRRMAMEIEQEEGTKTFKSDPTIRPATIVPGDKAAFPKPRKNTKWETDASRDRKMDKALEYLKAFQINNEAEASTVANLIEKLTQDLKVFDDGLKEKAVFKAKVNRAKDVAAIIMHEAYVQRNLQPDPVPVRQKTMELKKAGKLVGSSKALAKGNGEESPTENEGQPPKDPAVINAEYVRFFKELLQSQKAAKEKRLMSNPDQEGEDSGPGYDELPGGSWYEEQSGGPEFGEPALGLWCEGPQFGQFGHQGLPPGAMCQGPLENFNFQNNMSRPQRPQPRPASQRQYGREMPRARNTPYAPREGASKFGSQLLSEPSAEEVQFIKQLMTLLSSAPENSQSSSTEMMVKSLLHKKPPTGNNPAGQQFKAASLTSAEKALYQQLMMMVASPTDTLSSNQMMQQPSETKNVKAMAKAPRNQNPSLPMAAVPRGRQKLGNAQMYRETSVPGSQRIGNQGYGAAERNSMAPVNPNFFEDQIAYSDPPMGPLHGDSRSQMREEMSYPSGMYSEESSYGRVPTNVADLQYDDYTADRAPNSKTGLPPNAPRSGKERLQDRGMVNRSQQGPPGHGLGRPFEDPELAQREMGLGKPFDDPELAQREMGLPRRFDGPELAQRNSGLRRPVDNPEWAEREKSGMPNEKRARLDRDLVPECDPEEGEEPPEDSITTLSVDLLKRIRGKDMFTVTAILSEFAENEPPE